MARLARILCRRAVRFGVTMLLCLTIASALLWLRSLRAVDQLDGRVRFTDFTFTSYAGRLDVVFARAYFLPMSEPDTRQPTLAQLRIDPNWVGGGYVSRSRWPIAQTTKAAATNVWFPSAEFDASIARQGRRQYRGTLHAVVPYWLATPLLAIAPTIAIVAWLRRRRRTQSPSACTHCGYDCRESPDCCPECGTRRNNVGAP